MHRRDDNAGDINADDGRPRARIARDHRWSDLSGIIGAGNIRCNIREIHDTTP